jgi:hypothetical protein
MLNFFVRWSSGLEPAQMFLQILVIWKLNTVIVKRIFAISSLISFSKFGQEKPLAVFKETVAGLVLRECILVSASGRYIYLWYMNIFHLL